MQSIPIRSISFQNELQVAVHLLLALYPKLGELKIYELFNGAHFSWIGMYIGRSKKNISLEKLDELGLFFYFSIR